LTTQIGDERFDVSLQWLEFLDHLYILVVAVIPQVFTRGFRFFLGEVLVNGVSLLRGRLFFCLSPPAKVV